MKPTILVLVLAGIAASPITAQTINRITPNTGSPTDFVYLEGTGLFGATAVEFTAEVGGTVGVTTVSQAPLFALSSTKVIAYLPLMPDFAAPDAAAPGNPLGSARVVTPAGPSNSLPYYFMQGTFLQTPTGYEPRQTGTLAIGTSLSFHNERPVVSFDITVGPPTAGQRFVMELENGPPFGSAVLLIGFPMSLPYFPIEDGWLVIDLALPVIVATGFTTDFHGDAQLPLRLPAGYFGAELAHQWVILDTGLPGNLAVSNGLRYRL